MAGFSDATESAVLALIYNATAWANVADNAATSPLTQIALALHSADPGDAGSQTTSEVAYTGYARVNVARTTGGWTISGTSPTQAALAATQSFPAGTGGSGTATNFSTGKTGGGATAIFNAGAISPNITLGNGITPQLTTSTVIQLD